MTGGDGDIADRLPQPPHPAPARREAALREALRRFDGGAPGPDRAIGTARPARPSSWNRPFAGALAGAFLVALIGLPLVWTSFDNYSGYPGKDGVRRPAAQAGEPGRGRSDPVRPDPRSPAKTPPAAAAETEAERPVPATPAAPEAEPASPFAASEAPPKLSEPAPSEVSPQESADVVVTGTRIRNPNLESAVPITSVGGEEFFANRQASRSARRGDWNACTIEDPGQDLDRCRDSLKTVARGAQGRAGAQLKEGLDSAWKGDVEDATAAFDRAIELSPRSSTAYLNRGLAWRRRGDLDKALADLDQAVRYAPNDARVLYHRGQLLRQRGDNRRARADEKRAVELDPRYAPLVRDR